MLTLTFFIIFWTLFNVQIRVIRLRKGLFRETYSIKEFTFDPHIAHFTRRENLYDKLKKIVR